MPNSEQPSSWVTERANCRLDVIFEALVQVIKRDVAEFNGLLPNQRFDRTASVACNGDGIAPIVRVYCSHESGIENKLTLTQHRTRIHVEAPRHNPLILSLAWDPIQRACLLMSHDDETQYTVGELSQVILAPFLFD